MSYQPTPYDEIEFLLVMMGFLFLKGPEIDLTDLPKIGSRYFCIFGTLEYLKTQKYRRIHENRTEVGNSDRPTCTITVYVEYPLLDCDRWLKLDLADVSEKHIVLLFSIWALRVCLFAGYRSQFLTYGSNFLAQGFLGEYPQTFFSFF